MVLIDRACRAVARISNEAGCGFFGWVVYKKETAGAIIIRRGSGITAGNWTFRRRVWSSCSPCADYGPEAEHGSNHRAHASLLQSVFTDADVK